MPSADLDAPVIGTPEFNSAFLSRWCGSPPCGPSDARQQRLTQAITLMLDRPFDALTVRRLAAAAGMSESSFARLFRARFGQPPIEFLKTERLRYAAHLLRTTSWPVKTIAMKTGYASRSYFSRAFQHVFGVPPTAIRADNTPTSALSELERERLVAVRRYDLFELPPAGCFDRIVALAARHFAVPIAFISLVGQDRIWFRARHGLQIAQAPRGPGLCASAILAQDALVVSNAQDDTHAQRNILVAGESAARFYAGIPLRTMSGHNLGALCIVDRTPRQLDRYQLDELKDLAAIVMDQLEARLAMRAGTLDRA